MNRFPQKFEDRMRTLLGEEYEAFAASYDRPRRRGLRVNVSRISVEEFLRITPFPLEKIPWVPNGFFYPEEVRPARHPYYAAGLYYLQEPSAMTPASRLPLRAGDRVLDLCAAPGGKATELASRLAVLDQEKENEGVKPEGLLVANDISPQRVKALLHNLEMNGTDNYSVLCETPERLAQAFPDFFDKILVDAPCSGEGMFRKEEEALRLWSPERVADFAGHQKRILHEAYRMLRPGGQLLYSTCTFSEDENEQQIAAFLEKHPDMTLQEIEPFEGFVRGKGKVKQCVRIWPHRMDGEGHFLALMRKEAFSGTDGVGGTEAADLRTSGFAEERRKSEKENPGSRNRRKKRESVVGRGNRRKQSGAAGEISGKEQRRLLEDFLRAAGNEAAAKKLCDRVEERQGKAFLPGVLRERLNGLHVIRGGAYLGEWKKQRFEPSQAWAMMQKPGACTTGGQTWRVLSLSAEDGRLMRYLAGESIPVENMHDGWVLLCVGDYPIGWAKVVRGTAKNHYPASWRLSV